jgi:hypothetical protein
MKRYHFICKIRQEAFVDAESEGEARRLLKKDEAWWKETDYKDELIEVEEVPSGDFPHHP